MERKFLYFVAAMIVLVLAGAFAYRLAGDRLIRAALVPTAEFKALPPAAANAYADDPGLWYSRPGKGADDPALWVPEGFAAGPEARAALFFVHPTSFLDRNAWNMPLDNEEANTRARLFIRGQASAFNEVAQVWAPRYRQATFGAFLTTEEDAQKAFDLAYSDVAAAFDAFLEANPKGPIFLAGHSQGALHLTRLLREKVAGTPLARRIVAAYVVGWPISLETDLAALGLPPCTAPDQPGCILSWQSFAEPADPKLILDTYDATTGFDGRPRRDTPFLCTNPLTGTQNGDAPAADNLGTLFPSDDFVTAELRPGAVPARCADRGFLLIGEGPKLPNYVLPGNNYHVFDITLFWGNVRADARRRLDAFGR
jgi:hypothetical protein